VPSGTAYSTAVQVYMAPLYSNKTDTEELRTLGTHLPTATRAPHEHERRDARRTTSRRPHTQPVPPYNKCFANQRSHLVSPPPHQPPPRAAALATECVEQHLVLRELDVGVPVGVLAAAVAGPHAQQVEEEVQMVVVLAAVPGVVRLEERVEEVLQGVHALAALAARCLHATAAAAAAAVAAAVVAAVVASEARYPAARTAHRRCSRCRRVTRAR
jgi:hypothetical protein